MTVPSRRSGRVVLCLGGAVAAFLAVGMAGCGRSRPALMRTGCAADGLSGEAIPPGSGEERPSGRFNLLITGASGPGIDYRERRPFLNGALDPATGWPGVFLDHFGPRPERVEGLRFVRVREGLPFPQVFRFDARGKLVAEDPGDFLAQAACRPVLILVQGNLTTPDLALGGLLWAHTWLERHGALPPNVLAVTFDWPSNRIYGNEVRDVNAKGDRAFVAGYRLAQFLQAFPPQSRVCLLGQSYGGRVVPTALHLLAGGSLKMDRREPICLSGPRTDLRLRAVVIEASIDHQWLNPGQPLGRTLEACEAFLNLHNRKDTLLALYPLLLSGMNNQPLGRVGLRPSDVRRLGPLALRYSQRDLGPLIGHQHTFLHVVAHPVAASWIAPYTFALDAPAR